MPKPSPRRDGREAALQFLFSHDLNKLNEDESLDSAIAAFWEIRNVGGDQAHKFANKLIQGILEHREIIDEQIIAALENYSMKRVTVVDRNLLRLAVYEISHSDHIPARAAINEAIEIAKRFGAEDSSRFVNGVLDRVLKTVDTTDEN